MGVLFLGSFFPTELREEIREKSKGAIANANDALQWSLIEGFSNLLPSLQIISLPHIGGFPFKFKSLWFKGISFKIKDKVCGESVGFFNLVGFKHINRYFRTKKSLTAWLRQVDEKKVIIIYDLHVPFLKAVADLKKKNPMLTVCLIIPDLHGHTGNKKDLLHNLLGRLESKILARSYQAVDCYVLLSKYMKEHLPINNKPCVTIEGVFNPVEDLDVNQNILKSDVKTIFYSGSLDERNGVLNLVNAFSMISSQAYRLIICGDGDTKEKMLAAQNQDPRIHYKGQVSRSDALKLQKEATLLINPRTPEGEYTRYSFPSKTMEYFASGTPVLMYCLEGVPDEYYNYCYTLTSLSIIDLAEKIIDICEQDLTELKTKGELAKQFIIEKKNPSVQCSKVLQLLTSC